MPKFRHQHEPFILTHRAAESFFFARPLQQRLRWGTKTNGVDDLWPELVARLRWPGQKQPWQTSVQARPRVLFENEPWWSGMRWLHGKDPISYPMFSYVILLFRRIWVQFPQCSPSKLLAQHRLILKLLVWGQHRCWRDTQPGSESRNFLVSSSPQAQKSRHTHTGKLTVRKERKRKEKRSKERKEGIGGRNAEKGTKDWRKKAGKEGTKRELREPKKKRAEATNLDCWNKNTRFLSCSHRL